MSAAALAVGQKIELNDGRTATVRFVGSTHFQTGDWVGIELEDATGKNDGSVKGERYFDCEQGYGMFLRPSGVRQVLEPAKPKTTARPRPSSVVNGVKKQDAAVHRRTSTLGAGTGSPTPGGSKSLAALRSPTKSPTKQLGSNGGSSAGTSRTGTPPAAGARRVGGAAAPPTRSRQSIAPASTSSASAAGRRTSTVPHAPATGAARSSRASILPPASTRAPASRTAPGRAPASRTAPPARAGPESRPSASGKEAEEDDSAQPDVLSPRESNISSAVSQSEAEDAQDGEEDTAPQANFAPPPPPPIPPDPAPRPTTSRRTSSPPASLHSQRTVRSTAQSTRQIEELEAKVRLLERKRAEDRDVKRGLEQAQQERDKYQGIIEKLQKKYQPQQQEIADLKKALGEAESRFQSVEEMQAEHDSIMEMATLDKEMAEETAEQLKLQLEEIRANHEELQLEVELLRDENTEFSKEMSPEERTSAGWLQMEKENERLRNALLRLRDLTQDRELELKEELEGLKGQAKEFETITGQYDETKEKLLTSEATADDLRQQLEAALGAEEMIEELTERNMGQQESINELRATIEDLENLRELNDELEVNHVEAEKQMQEEIDFKDSLLLDRERTAKQQQEALDDADYTINRFRELVGQLQSDLQDMQASKQISDTEAADLSSKSRAMLDLNMKLQSSAAKTQVKTIDLELRKLDAQEASEHLAIVQLFLPEAFHAERDSVLALLRFKRIGFKASLVHSFVKERIASASARGFDDNVFPACNVLDKLTWVSGMADRFVNSICSCSVEEFANYEGALYELEPVERALNGYIDGLRRDELKERDMSQELQRSIAVMSHLASLHVKDDLASHADDLLMRSLYLQSQLESTASALGLTRTLVETKLPKPADDENDEDEDGPSDTSIILNRAEALISHARSAKVMAGKTHRALSDLQARSLTLEATCTDTFVSVETIANQITDFSRHAGDALQTLFGEEGRSEPFTSHEVSSALSRAATSAFSLSNSEAGPFTALAGKLRDLSDVLADLASLPTDLDNTVEFERAPAPWVARAEQLKTTKLTAQDTEAELSRARETLRERDVVVKEKETELEEQSVRIEMLEARMKDASKRSARIAELEKTLHDAKDGEKRAKAELATAKKEAQSAVERARDEMARVAEQRGVKADETLDANAMGTGAQLTLKRQEHQITSLQGAVRYLQSESHRLRNPPPNNTHEATTLSWLHEPLLPPRPTEPASREAKQVLNRLLALGSKEHPQLVDLTSLPENKLAWRPVRESSRWKVQRAREEWEGWRGWRREVVREAVVGARPRVVRKGEVGLGEPKIVHDDEGVDGLSSPASSVSS